MCSFHPVTLNICLSPYILQYCSHSFSSVCACYAMCKSRGPLFPHPSSSKYVLPLSYCFNNSHFSGKKGRVDCALWKISCEAARGPVFHFWSLLILVLLFYLVFAVRSDEKRQRETAFAESEQMGQKTK